MGNDTTSFRVKIRNGLNAMIRSVNQLRRPSKSRNIRLLQERGEDLQSFVFRDAADTDVPAIAEVHVISWNDTYNARRGPSRQLRENQWREIFRSKDQNWFCIVIENKDGNLVGFAKGKSYSHTDLSDYSGELNKIYLLPDYQRLGLGRQLFARVAKRFLSQGINSIVLFGIPQNPTCRFYEAMGGKRLLSPRGEFNGGYGWMDLGIFKS
jgi:GNAT superfamily N-acetyltransferase